MRSFFRAIVVSILTYEARLVLRKYKPRVVAVTGSVGKTSTKDAIFAALAPLGRVRKSDKSFNSEIGVPLTILGLKNAWNNPFAWLQNILDGLLLAVFPTQYPSVLVLEVGADRPGDIRSLASWLPVDVAVITYIPDVPVHVEYFNSPKEVLEEKAALIHALRSHGTLVLLDDARTRALSPRAPGRVLVYGWTDGADVRGYSPAVLYGTNKAHHPTGLSMRVVADKEVGEVVLNGTVGEHAALSLLAAIAVGYAFDLPLAHSTEALASYVPPPGRMRIIEGLKDTVVIDDTYNASPAAVEAALNTLSSLRVSGRKVVVLGDMLELGRHSVEEHRKIGAVVAKTANLLLTVGFRARDIAQGALDNGMSDGAIFQYEETERAGDELQNMLRVGDCVLIKGSQSMRMEKVVESVMREPERSGELLVRQEEEWKRR